MFFFFVTWKCFQFRNWMAHFYISKKRIVCIWFSPQSAADLPQCHVQQFLLFFFSDFRRSKTMHTPHFPQHTAISVNLVSFLSFCQPNFQRNGSLIAKAYHWRRSKTPLLKLFHLTRKLQICVQIVSLIIIGIRINVEQAIPKKMLLNGIFNLHSPFALDLAWVLV